MPRQSWFWRFVRGLLSKDHSFATGVLLALLVWTLTRIIDSIVGSASIEYDITHTSRVLPNGSQAKVLSISLTNLSRDSALRDLQLAIHDPARNLEFVDPGNACTFPQPAWADKAECVTTKEGLKMKVPWLIPGAHVNASVGYTSGQAALGSPVVRIQPGVDANTKIRLVEPGLATWMARHEFGILVSILVITALFLILSLAAGLTPSKTAEPGGEKAS